MCFKFLLTQKGQNAKKNIFTWKKTRITTVLILTSSHRLLCTFLGVAADILPILAV